MDIREMAEADLPAIVALLTEGFLRRRPIYWLRGFKNMRAARTSRRSAIRLSDRGRPLQEEQAKNAAEEVAALKAQIATMGHHGGDWPRPPRPLNWGIP